MQGVCFIDIIAFYHILQYLDSDHHHHHHHHHNSFHYYHHCPISFTEFGILMWIFVPYLYICEYYWCFSLACIDSCSLIELETPRESRWCLKRRWWKVELLLTRSACENVGCAWKGLSKYVSNLHVFNQNPSTAAFPFVQIPSAACPTFSPIKTIDFIDLMHMEGSAWGGHFFCTEFHVGPCWPTGSLATTWPSPMWATRFSTMCVVPLRPMCLWSLWPVVLITRIGPVWPPWRKKCHD